MRSLRPAAPAAAPTIRAARASDAAMLARLEAEVDEVHARAAPRFFRARAGGGASRLAAAIASPDETVLVAEAGGKVAGAVHAAILDTPPDPALAPVRRLFVDILVVTTTARRRGIGRRLLAEAERWAQTRGATQSVLTVWEGNQAAACFYQSLGYGTLHRVLVRDL